MSGARVSEVEARGEVLSALSADDPITTMRAVAIDLASRGLAQASVEGAFGSVASELHAVGREDEAGLVLEVLDMMAEWYAGGKAID